MISDKLSKHQAYSINLLLTTITIDHNLIEAHINNTYRNNNKLYFSISTDTACKADEETERFNCYETKYCLKLKTKSHKTKLVKTVHKQKENYSKNNFMTVFNCQQINYKLAERIQRHTKREKTNTYSKVGNNIPSASHKINKAQSKVKIREARCDKILVKSV